MPLSVILRNPIEVWVSCGENFIRPDTAEKLYETSLKAQMDRNASNLVLDTEKHTLRHMQGWCVVRSLVTGQGGVFIV